MSDENVMSTTYTTSNTKSQGASGSAGRNASVVPERFRSVTDVQPGRSAVPDRFRSVTQPTPARSKSAKTTAVTLT